MKTQNNGKKTAVIAAAGLGAVALLGAGALALFSDVDDTAQDGTVGTVSLLVTNPDLQNKSNINPGDNDAMMWGSLYKNNDRHYIPTSEDPLFVPGASHNENDYSSYVTISTTPHDLTFTVANTGTKSIRTRQTFIISVYQVEEGDDGKTSPTFLPANVFTLYEDGTYYGTKNQDILDVHDTTDYKKGTAPKNVFADEYAAVDLAAQKTLANFNVMDDAMDNSKKRYAYEESVADRMTQPWEELAYKYYIDENDNEYLVAVPNGDLSFVKVGDMPTADDIDEIPFGTLIKAVKYVVYSDIFDGVTDDNDKRAAEIEGAFGDLSNLGTDKTNVSVIPDAYHVQSELLCEKIIKGNKVVYYQDQNANRQYALVDMTTEKTLGYVFFNPFHDLFIMGNDGDDVEKEEVTLTIQGKDYTAKEGEYIVGLKASEVITALDPEGTANVRLWPVELNTEIKPVEGGVDQIVFCDSIVDMNGDRVDGSVRIPLVHAYNAKEYRYMLGMSKMATNKYQGASVTIDVIVEAMQYRNTSGLADWEAISTNTITTALDFTDKNDTHTSITVPEKEEEPMHKGELTGTGNSTDDAIEGDAYVGTTEFTRP